MATFNNIFKKGDKVRCIHETQPGVVVGISRDDYSYFYDITYYGNSTVHRIPEIGLVSYQEEMPTAVVLDE